MNATSDWRLPPPPLEPPAPEFNSIEWEVLHLASRGAVVFTERVDRFVTHLEHQDYEGAYGVWLADPAWRQHPQKYQRYTYNDFYRDWGPGGQWGLIKSHKIEAAVRPPRGGTGVIVVVTINRRAEKAFVWVERSDLSLSFSPYEVELR